MNPLFNSTVPELPLLGRGKVRDIHHKPGKLTCKFNTNCVAWSNKR